MDIISIALATLGFAYVGLPLLYILWMRHIALTHPWNVRKDERYLPRVDILLPTYNEEQVISQKLWNLCMLNYPQELLRIIVIDSCSADRTFALASKFAEENDQVRISVIQEGRRSGKSVALNLGLSLAQGETVVTTDADAYWDPDVLTRVIAYLADPEVGAVTGTESVLNPSQSLATVSEVAYHDGYLWMRLGESKIHSTLITNGELMAYRRHLNFKFDETSGSDDSGTAVNIVEAGFRCIQVPEAKYYDNVYYTWRGKTIVKARRAEQLVGLWLRCLKDAFRRRLILPNLVLLSNIYLHILNPVLGVLFYFVAIVAVMQQPLLLLLLLPFLALKSLRSYAVSFVAHNAFLLTGLFQHATGKRQTAWKKVQETRALQAAVHGHSGYISSGGLSRTLR